MLQHPMAEEYLEVTGAKFVGAKLFSNREEVSALAQRRISIHKRYGYGVLTEEAVKLLANLSPIVEIGAGSGYNAWLITQLGGSVVAFDAYPSFWQKHWFEVKTGGAEKAAEFSQSTLFLCWPPRENFDGTAAQMAKEALEHYIRAGGKMLAAVIEDKWEFDGDISRRSQTGCREFYSVLEQKFYWESSTPVYNWPNTFDSLQVYRVRQ